MVSDSIAAAPIPSAANTKNPGKKKRTNRSAKLKQYKIDARREQWLSQGAIKNRGCKDRIDDDNHAPPSPVVKQSKRSLELLKTIRRGEVDDVLIHQDSDLELLSNSPNSPDSSVLCGNDSGTNFTGSSSSVGGSSSSSSSSSSGGCCSGNITEEEEEEEDDGCLDDWEAVADALAADDKHRSPPSHEESVVETVSPGEVGNGLGLSLESPNSNQGSGGMVPWGSVNSKAWRVDDAYRPQSLPNLSKQHSMPNPNRLCGGGIPWSRSSVPSSCPICFEDLDLTDTSFLPCLCGFRLCLFCHKRILEEDARCPGCRKPYEREPVETEASVLGGSVALRLARSCSMIERS